MLGPLSIEYLDWFFIVTAILSLLVGIYAAYLTRKQNNRKALLIETSNGDARILKLLLVFAVVLALIASVSALSLIELSKPNGWLTSAIQSIAHENLSEKGISYDVARDTIFIGVPSSALETPGSVIIIDPANLRTICPGKECHINIELQKYCYDGRCPINYTTKVKAFVRSP
jgi:hypothetical protein